MEADRKSVGASKSNPAQAEGLVQTVPVVRSSFLDFTAA